ncbi:hypothetical protein BH11MYX4_BH11MYX4_55500 [soil metagenome]
MKRLCLALGVSFVTSAALLLACGGSSSTVGGEDAATDASSDAPTDPCDGVTLPACPRRCEAFPMTGTCTSGDRCAVSEVGDDCQCQGGSWTCAIHPPLGLGCNEVCRDLEPVDGGTDGAADGGLACGPTVKDPCGPNAYCKSSDCVSGACAPRPAETSSAESPVCGCDDITYWNDNVAAARGMSVKAKDACKSAVKCGGPGPTKACPAGFSCDMEVASAGGCAIQSAPGVCWALPKTCPAILIGPVTRACGAGACEGRCQLVDKQETYYRDNSCPQ